MPNSSYPGRGGDNTPVLADLQSSVHLNAAVTERIPNETKTEDTEELKSQTPFRFSFKSMDVVLKRIQNYPNLTVR